MLTTVAPFGACRYIEEAFFSFLLVGHTHEDIDWIFSIISRFFRALQVSEALTPQTFEQNMRDSLDQKFDVLTSQMLSVVNWTTYLSPSLHAGITGIQHRLLEADSEEETARSPRTFWIHRRPTDGVVVLHYKEYCQHPTWLPPLDPTATPLKTNPEGIEIFRRETPPPDPMQTPPPEVPLHAVFYPASGAAAD